MDQSKKSGPACQVFLEQNFSWWVWPYLFGMLLKNPLTSLGSILENFLKNIPDCALQKIPEILRINGSLLYV